MKKLLLILLSAFVLFITGCAQTPYQPNGFLGGFTETRLGENVFRVTFQGNGYTGKNKVADFTLLRSAELALEHGFRYFIITESGKGNYFSTFTTPTTSHTTGRAYKSGSSVLGNATTHTYGGQTFIISAPSANNTIVLYKEKPKINVLVYDASFLKRSIKQKYGLNKNSATSSSGNKWSNQPPACEVDPSSHACKASKYHHSFIPSNQSSDEQSIPPVEQDKSLPSGVLMEIDRLAGVGQNCMVPIKNSPYYHRLEKRFLMGSDDKQLLEKMSITEYATEQEIKDIREYTAMSEPCSRSFIEELKLVDLDLGMLFETTLTEDIIDRAKVIKKQLTVGDANQRASEREGRMKARFVQLIKRIKGE